MICSMSSHRGTGQGSDIFAGCETNRPHSLVQDAIMKTCKKCKEEKHLSCFSKNKAMRDGVNGWCQSCYSSYRKENREAINRSKRAWAKRNPVKYLEMSRTYRANNRAKVNAITRKYQETHPETVRERKRIYRARSPIKINAHRDVRAAMLRGEIHRGNCNCGAATKAEAHHKDYSKPMEIEWLCRICHMQWHIENGPGLNG